MTHLIADSTTGKACNAKMWFSVFSLFVCIRYLVSGITFGDLSISEFDGNQVALVLGVFASTYGWRAHEKHKNKGVQL